MPTPLPPGLSAEQVLDAIVTLAPIRIGILDDAGRFTVSTSYPQIVGQSFFDVFAERGDSVENVRAVLNGQNVEWIDSVDGVSYRICARPFVDHAGRAGAILIGSLITAELEAERRMRLSEGRFRHIVDSNLLAVMFWDETGHVVDANDAFLRLLGYGRADLDGGGLPIAAILAPGFEAEDERAREEIHRTGRCAPYEKALLHRTGAPVPVLIGASRFDKERSAGAAFVLDLSEQRKREAERDELRAKLLQVQKLESLGLLAGGIAHDFNNLLTAVLGGAATALMVLPAESPARRDIELAMDAARRAADLTRQLLAYSGKGHFQIKPLDLSATVKELAALLETTLPKKVQLRLELMASIPAVEADAVQVQQVIMNLVINGAEAIGEGSGTVLVTTGVQDLDAEYVARVYEAEKLAPGRYVFLEVHDTGCGMSPETQAKVFDPFFSTKFTGRGLGLAAVLGIVGSHRGAIRVYSTPGRGTTFKVLFPATGATATTTKPRGTSYRGSGLVLVVDDDDAVRRAARRMLTHYGFSVLEAENGLEAVAAFRNRADEIALVLLDMTMPVMDGEECFRELRAIRADVPVLLTSGYNEVEATRRFTSKGVTSFLQKPFMPADLIAKLAVLLPTSSPDL